MKVYHGSYIAIENIDFTFSRKKRDFGRGFYVTKILSQEEYWASRKGEDNDMEGVVTEFEFYDTFFEEEEWKLLRFNGYSEEWLDFVVKNRINNSDQQVHDYDIIEGPVADDDIATKVYSYINGKVTKKQFLSELKRKTPTHQICFCTLRSLQALELHKEHVDVEIIQIDNDVIKTLMADYGISIEEAAGIYYTSKTYSLLADESTGLFLKSWQEIYQMLLTEMKL